MFNVTTELLCYLTIAKMITITRNRWSAKAHVRKVCCRIWATIFIPSVGLYVIDRCRIISVLSNLRFPIFTIPAVFLQTTCYVLTCNRLEIHARRVSGAGNSLNRQFTRMALFQVCTFSMCSLPVSLYSLFEHFRLTDINLKTRGIIYAVANLSSFVDPIVFFIVYGNKLRR